MAAPVVAGEWQRGTLRSTLRGRLADERRNSDLLPAFHLAGIAATYLGHSPEIDRFALKYLLTKGSVDAARVPPSGAEVSSATNQNLVYSLPMSKVRDRRAMPCQAGVGATRPGHSSPLPSPTAEGHRRFQAVHLHHGVRHGAADLHGGLGARPRVRGDRDGDPERGPFRHRHHGVLQLLLFRHEVGTGEASRRSGWMRSSSAHLSCVAPHPQRHLHLLEHLRQDRLCDLQHGQLRGPAPPLELLGRHGVHEHRVDRPRQADG